MLLLKTKGKYKMAGFITNSDKDKLESADELPDRGSSGPQSIWKSPT